jgi:C-terminal processing protease CtpA/Prc
VEKSSEPLGIKIDTSNNGGIFVSSVNDNSLARKAGVQIGDQLLEVCGINLRTATYDDAARILRQCDGSINMLVQYNPNSKYQ